MTIIRERSFLRPVWKGSGKGVDANVATEIKRHGAAQYNRLKMR
jgi:hypothetical protein